MVISKLKSKPYIIAEIGINHNGIYALAKKLIIESIANQSKNITTVIIAHRLNTIKNCDCIYYLENGRIKSYGTYEELILKSVEFKKLATSLAL